MRKSHDNSSYNLYWLNAKWLNYDKRDTTHNTCPGIQYVRTYIMNTRIIVRVSSIVGLKVCVGGGGSHVILIAHLHIENNKSCTK